MKSNTPISNIQDKLDEINLNTDHIESLNNIMFDLIDRVQDTDLASKFYALNHSIDSLLKETNQKTQVTFMLLANVKEKLIND